MHGKRRATRRAWVLAASGLVALAALAGGAGTGQAGATLLDVELSSLGSITSFSAGGTIGYAASVENTGASTVSHVSLVVDTALGNAAGAGTYRVSSVSGHASASCAVHPDKSSAMLCTASQLSPDDGFSVNVAFSAPASFVPTVPAPVTFNASANATVSAQTNGNPGNNGTSSWGNGAPVSATLTKASELSFRTFSLPGDDPFETGVNLKTKIDLPAAFLNGHFGLVTEAGEYTDAASKRCDKCPIVFSNVSIPASLDEDTNPFASFVEGVLITKNPYTFVLTLNPSGQPNGYKPSGISHRGDEAGALFEPVPLCTASTPSADVPICLDALPSKDKKTGVITATGKGIENGSYGWD
jgi:hypothetical protein